jgi:hypothetical protein
MFVLDIVLVLCQVGKYTLVQELNMVPLLALILEGMVYMVTKLVLFLVGMFVLEIVLVPCLGGMTQYPGQTFQPGKEPTLSPFKPFPPDLLPTQPPYLTPGPGYTYPPGKVPTQYPGQTYAPGKEPTL